jgi:uncharacterized protein YutE (UPF0331/DUF86 family)
VSKRRTYSSGDTALVDRHLIGRKLSEIEVYYGQIKEYSGISLKTYKSDWKIQRIVERTLQVLIELCIDMANHIISDEDLRLSTGYADTFRVLMENNIISKELCKSMEKMAKFRNVIVHQYETIEPSIIISILHKNLVDFEKYQKAIIKHLR